MNHPACSQLYFPSAVQEDALLSASPRLIIHTCQHILESDAFCQAAAVGGRSYCRAHLLLRVRRLKMARARRRARSLKLPSLMDQQSVRKARAQVRVALAAGHIDAELAGLLSYAMRQASSNLRFIQQQEELALRKNSSHSEPRSLGPHGVPPSCVLERTKNGRRSGEPRPTARPGPGGAQLTARPTKSKRHY